jgi:hypothetical protein
MDSFVAAPQYCFADISRIMQSFLYIQPYTELSLDRRPAKGLLTHVLLFEYNCSASRRGRAKFGSYRNG